MIVLLGDTHRRADPGLTGTIKTAVETATAVVHTGDFVTTTVLEAFETATAGRFIGVHGNADTTAVREQLPERRMITVDGYRLAVTHGHDRSRTALSLFGREAGADLVVVGHTHRPGISTGVHTVCNPGSHSRPRGGPRTYAIVDGDGGRIKTVSGRLMTEFSIG